MQLKKFNPIFSFLFIIFSLEFFERLIDSIIGDGDGEITGLKLSVIITLFQFFLLLLCFFWIGEVIHRLRNQQKERYKRKKNVFERNSVAVMLSFTFFLIFIVDFVAAQWFLKKTPQQEKAKEFRISHKYYHHDLLPNKKAQDIWGGDPYNVFTNSLGFKDAQIREIPLKIDRKRILLLGDSFTEGVGMPFEKTFAGMVNLAFKDSIDILNAGCVSYSPKLYYLKTKYLLEKQLKFDELFVFIDISDIQDETIYESFTSRDETSLNNEILGKEIAKYEIKLPHDTKNYNTLHGSFSFAINQNKLIDDLNENSFFFHYIYNYKGKETKSVFHEERGYWTVNEEIYKKWGAKGVALAQENMKKLVDLCQQNFIKLTIVVYPRPEQIETNDLDSKQVKIWKQFAVDNKINFLNFFPNYINEESKKNYQQFYDKYFIKGDVHWNEAGNKIIADSLINYIKTN
jgi:lysophospholipase L1-like esterase